MRYPADLQKALLNKKATFVTGAGFSTATSPSLPINNWTRLIQLAAEFAQRAFPQNQVIEGLANELGDANSSFTEMELTQFAGLIKTTLSKKSAQLYADFFIKYFKDAQVEDPSLGEILGSFECGLATTNYDTLLEQAIGLPAGPTLLSDEVDDALSVLRNEKLGVVHLHGRWDKPDSILFSADDYSRHLANLSATSAQLSTYSMTKFIFVGQGAGIMDPNFTAIKNAWKQVASVSTHYHYLLCRDKDVAYFEEILAGSTIHPLPYGPEFADLNKFLKGLLESVQNPNREIEVYQVAQCMTDEIHETLRASSLAHQNLVAAEPASNLVVEPTFIPMPHEQFAHEILRQERENVPQENRINQFVSSDIIESENSWLIVGEEQSGITTALKWLLLECHQIDSDIAPVYVDHLKYSNNNRLNRLIAQEFAFGGIKLRPKDSFPRFNLAVDSFTAGSKGIYGNFINDVLGSGASRTFIGCRLGSEQDLARMLLQNGLQIKIAYLGKPGVDEVKRYANIIAPHAPLDAAEQTLKIIRKEHLPRNPFTVSLVLRLISVNVSQIEKLQSQADLIAGFLDLMLSQVNVNGSLDGRETLVYSNVEVILMQLAETLVRERNAQIPASKIVNIFEEVINKKEWRENALEWVERLVTHRLLAVSDNEYSFRQSSYLYYFAARAAAKNAEFLSFMLQEPLMHAPIIKLVASISRDNESLVESTASILDEWRNVTVHSVIYDRVVKQDAASLDSLSETMSVEENESEADFELDDQASVVPSYDYSSDKDITPFPLHELSDVSDTVKIAVAVDLASVVLRESNEIDDRHLKDQSLETILSAWGVYLDMLERDEDVRKRIRDATIESAQRHGLDDLDVDSVMERFNPVYCTFVVWGALCESIRSKKLRASLDRVRSEAIEGGSLALMGGVALMELTDTSRGWATRVAACEGPLRHRWIYSVFVTDIVMGHFVGSELLFEDEKAATQIIANKMRSLYSFQNQRHEKTVVDSIITNLKKYRLNKQAMIQGLSRMISSR